MRKENRIVPIASYEIICFHVLFNMIHFIYFAFLGTSNVNREYMYVLSIIFMLCLYHVEVNLE